MTSEENKTSFWQSLGILASLFALGVGVLYVSGLLLRKQDEETPRTIPVIKEVPVVRPDCPRNFESYSALVNEGSYVVLASDTRGYAASRVPVVVPPSKEVLRVGKIACGYLFIRAERTSGQALDVQYDSVYVNPHGRGGHIFRPGSIVDDTKEETVVLLPLNDIRYRPGIPYTTDPNDPALITANWIDLLNSGEITKFDFVLSTESRSAKLKEVTAAYKCWNPETGRETKDCALKGL